MVLKKRMLKYKKENILLVFHATTIAGLSRAECVFLVHLGGGLKTKISQNVFLFLVSMRKTANFVILFLCRIFI